VRPATLGLADPSYSFAGYLTFAAFNHDAVFICCPTTSAASDNFLPYFASNGSSLHWCVCCSGLVLFSAEVNMKMFADSEVQARLMREIQESYDKRGKLEAGIRAIERARSLRVEGEALREIAEYRALQSRQQSI
jgi:hypothetical protein